MANPMYTFEIALSNDPVYNIIVKIPIPQNTITELKLRRVRGEWLLQIWAPPTPYAGGN